MSINKSVNHGNPQIIIHMSQLVNHTLYPLHMNNTRILLLCDYLSIQYTRHGNIRNLDSQSDNVQVLITSKPVCWGPNLPPGERWTTGELAGYNNSKSESH